jgi:glutamate:GABA antiporter
MSDAGGAPGPAAAGGRVGGPRLHRALGLADVTLFLIVAVLGTRWIATAAAVGPAALTLWLVGFVALFVPLAFTVVELSSRYPEEGGLYVWTRRAFGDYAGFVAGWMYMVSNLSFFPGLLYFAAGSALYAFGPSALALSASVPYYITTSLVGLALALAFNLVGLKVGRWLHNAGAWGAWLPVGLLVVAGALVFARHGSATHFEPSAFLPAASLENFLLCSTIAFAFGGLESASFLGEEIESPRRTIPRAILLGGAAITLIYVLGTLAVLVSVPREEVSSLQGILQATDRAAGRVGLPWISPVAALLLAIGGIGGVGAWLASGARLAYVTGVDRYLPASFGRVHPKWGTPHVALIAQAAGAALFTLLSQLGTGVRGAYEALTALTAIAYFIPLMLMFAAMIALQREPAPAGAARVPGGRPVATLLGALGLATTTVGLVLAALPAKGDPHPALSVAKIVGGSMVTLAIGSLLFLRGSRRPSSGNP